MLRSDLEFKKRVQKLIDEDKKYKNVQYSLFGNQLTIEDYYRSKAALEEHFELEVL